MSRSRRKPFSFSSITCIGARPGVQHSWKKSESRKIRRIVKQRLSDEDFESEMVFREKLGDIYESPSDGKWECDSEKSRRK